MTTSHEVWKNYIANNSFSFCLFYTCSFFSNEAKFCTVQQNFWILWNTANTRQIQWQTRQKKYKMYETLYLANVWVKANGKTIISHDLKGQSIHSSKIGKLILFLVQALFMWNWRTSCSIWNLLRLFFARIFERLRIYFHNPRPYPSSPI